MGKVKLESICTIVSGSTPKSSCPEYWGGSIKWVTPAEISDETHYIEDTERHITEEGMRSCHLRMMPSGTVLLSSRAPIGKTAITKSAMCCNQGFKNLICGNSISNEYLYHFLKSKTDELKSIGRGATFKEISKKQVESITINLPALDEQNRRTAALGQIDMLLKQNRKLTGIIDDLVKSRFVEMFGDPTEANKQAWSYSRLGDLLLIERGGSPRPIKSFLTNDSRGINWIKIGDATDGSKFITGTKEKIKKEGVRFSRIVHKGDFLLSNSMSFGRPYILDIEGCIHDGWLVLRDEQGQFDSLWLYEALSSQAVYEAFKQRVRGGVVNNLNKDLVSSVTLIVPPLALQQEFAAFVSQVDKLRFATQQQIEKLETLKKSLMQEYFG